MGHAIERWILSVDSSQWLSVAILLAFAVAGGLWKRKIDKEEGNERGKEGS